MATYSHTLSYDINVPEPDMTMTTDISLECTEDELALVNERLAEAKEAIAKGLQKSEKYRPLDQMKTRKLFFERTDGKIRIERHSQDDAADIIPVISYIKRVVPSIGMVGKMYTVNPYFGNRAIWKINGPKGGEALEVESGWGPVAPGDTDVSKPHIVKSSKQKAASRGKYSNDIVFNTVSTSGVIEEAKRTPSSTGQHKAVAKTSKEENNATGWRSGTSFAQKESNKPAIESKAEKTNSADSGWRSATTSSTSPVSKTQTPSDSKTSGWRSATASSVESSSKSVTSTAVSATQSRPITRAAVSAAPGKPKQQGWRSGTANPNEAGASGKAAKQKPKSLGGSGKPSGDYPVTKPTATRVNMSGYNGSAQKGKKKDDVSPIVWWLAIPGLVGFFGELVFSGFNIGISIFAALIFAICGGIAYVMDKSKKRK